MSLRDKAREIKSAAEAERGNFQPTGVPLRMYNYWLKNTESEKGWDIRNGFRKENFCHFWRVVVFWSPLRWVFNNVINTVPFMGTVFALISIGFLFACFAVGDFGAVVVTVFGLLALIVLAGFGMFGGISMAFCDNDHDREKHDLPKAKVAKWLMLIPTAWFAYGFVKFAEWKHALKFSAVVGGLSFVGLLTFIGFVEAWWTPFAVVGAIIGGAGAIIGAALLLVTIGDFISGRRRARKNRAEAQESVILAESGDLNAEPREPGMLSKFFSGIGDFLVLLTQIVRVKKWKICPLVEVNHD